MSDIDFTSLDSAWDLSKEDPDKAMNICREFIIKYPESPYGYSERHHLHLKKGELREALADCNRVIQLGPHEKGGFFARGEVHRKMGDYQKAIDDYDHAFELDHEGWYGSMGLLSRLDCHARLGNREQALADCARLTDDFWTPGVFGLPAGNRADVTAKVLQLLDSAPRNGKRRT
ncbi:MAG TPA: tetratricopeptide repeat protein [Stellaceae bacterium]|nr:tetratricopeptide repeat protein [Stellaceae bacterium]